MPIKWSYVVLGAISFVAGLVLVLTATSPRWRSTGSTVGGARLTACGFMAMGVAFAIGGIFFPQHMK